MKYYTRRSFFKTATSLVAASTLAASSRVLSIGGSKPAEDERNLPEIRWTAGKDEMNFRYDFLNNVETTILYRATPEYGMFSHQPFIVHFKDTLIAAWDNHIRDENGSGQRSSYRFSKDQGETWSQINELFPPLDKEAIAPVAYIGSRTQKLSGFVTVDDKLYALSDVADWAGTSIAQRYSVNHGLLCRRIDANGTLGDIFILGDEDFKPVKGFSSYPAGPSRLVNKIIETFETPGNELQIRFEHDYPDSDDNHRLGEPTNSWKLKDDTWVKLYRDNGIQNPKNALEREASKSRRNYASFSFDNGQTWTAPTRTNFPDCCARTNAGNLPDGQIYVINNLLPLSTKYGGRTLLAISLSENGLVFDRVAMIRFNHPSKRDLEGRAKAEGYQYPHSVVHNNYLWVIYSVNKEDIEVSRISLKELDRLPYYQTDV